MKFIPYMDFDGQCSEAFDFYQRIFAGKVARFTYGESPMAADMPAATHNRIMHAQLETAGTVLMGADGPPHSQSNKGCVNIQVESAAEAERIFAALSEGASVQMPLGETFWAHRFGMLTDRYGKGWMINCMKPMP